MLIAYTSRDYRQDISDRLQHCDLVHGHEHLYTMRMHHFSIKITIFVQQFSEFFTI